MKVAKIRISNILGIEELEIEPGSVTEISGQNGTGKTSVLEAVRAALGGGHDATLIRRGADKGQVVLELEDGVQITKEIAPGRSSVRVSHPGLGQVSRGQTWLNGLVDQFGMNPVDFLTAPKKRRVELLLEAIPMRVTPGQIAEATGDPADFPVVPVVGTDGHALEVIAQVSRRYYDERTGLNRAAREKRAGAAEMERNLPEGLDEGWDAKEAGLAGEIRTLREMTQSASNQCRQSADEQVTRIREEAAERIREIEYRRDQSITAALAARDTELDRIRGEYEPAHQSLTQDLAQARAKAQAWRDAAKTREFIERQKGEAEAIEEDARLCTRAIEGLERLKATLLESLPIPGLEILDGDIVIDGIPFDRVNESQRIRAAMEIARLRSGDLGLVVVDGLERLDRASYEAFKSEAARSGLQFIVTRVSDDPELTVVQEGAA